MSKQYTTLKPGEVQGSVSGPHPKLDYMQEKQQAQLLGLIQSVIEERVKQIINDVIYEIIENYWGDVVQNITNVYSHFIANPPVPYVPNLPVYKGQVPIRVHGDIIKCLYNTNKAVDANESNGLFIKIDEDGKGGLYFDSGFLAVKESSSLDTSTTTGGGVTIDGSSGGLRVAPEAFLDTTTPTP